MEVKTFLMPGIFRISFFRRFRISSMSVPDTSDTKSDLPVTS